MDPLSAAFDRSRLAENVDGIRARIEAARTGANAAPSVTLVAVTKAFPAEILHLLPDAGILDVGENRVQPAIERRPGAPEGLTWHGIGHLQRNKARAATEVFDVFHALDSLRLARRLDAVLAEQGAVWPVYLQVNASGEPQKSGFQPEEALSALESVLACPHLRPMGWMTMAAAGAEEGDLRQTFRTLRGVRDEAARTGLGDPPPVGLSMGMSNDFEIAVQEGATAVRIGRALFRGVCISVPTNDDQGGAPA